MFSLFRRKRQTPTPQQPEPRKPRTTEERAAEHHREVERILRVREESGTVGAAEIERGRVDGVHYLELIEPIKQAKRDGDNEYALQLCYQAIQGAEQARDGREPAPGYTKHAAIVLRKLGRRDEEIDVLERYLQFVAPEHRASDEFTERIQKVKALKRSEER